MTHPSFIQIRAIGPLVCRGDDKSYSVMEVVVSENKVQFKKHFYGRETGAAADKRYAQAGRRKLIDQASVVSLDTPRSYMNFIDFLAGVRGVEVPAFADEGFYEPDSATWERGVTQAA